MTLKAQTLAAIYTLGLIALVITAGVLKFTPFFIAIFVYALVGWVGYFIYLHRHPETTQTHNK